jgi:hypothetical protein
LNEAQVLENDEQPLEKNVIPAITASETLAQPAASIRFFKPNPNVMEPPKVPEGTTIQSYKLKFRQNRICRFNAYNRQNQTTMFREDSWRSGILRV